MFTKRRSEKKTHIDLQLAGSILLGGVGLAALVLAATGFFAPLGLAIFAGVMGGALLGLSAAFIFRIFENFFKEEPAENTYRLI